MQADKRLAIEKWQSEESLGGVRCTTRQRSDIIIFCRPGTITCSCLLLEKVVVRAKRMPCRVWIEYK